MLFVARVLPAGEMYLPVLCKTRGENRFEIFHIRLTRRQGERALASGAYRNILRDHCLKAMKIPDGERARIRPLKGEQLQEYMDKLWGIDDDKAVKCVLDARPLELH